MVSGKLSVSLMGPAGSWCDEAPDTGIVVLKHELEATGALRSFERLQTQRRLQDPQLPLDSRPSGLQVEAAAGDPS